jgi:hypothetical protein
MTISETDDNDRMIMDVISRIYTNYFIDWKEGKLKYNSKTMFECS